MRQALFTAITRLGHAVDLAEDCEEALRKVQETAFDLVFSDLKLMRGGGLRLLKEIKRQRPETPVVVMSTGGGLEEAVAAMREGAQDYLIKPFPAGVVDETIARVLAQQEDGARREESARSQAQAIVERRIVSESLVMGRLLKLAENMAKSSATVLLEGESGTGKELLARFIHQNSDRAAGPFVAVNCAGLPESLLESELFGHEKGAFTGALARKPGKFDLASGGTMLLDEITEMDISLQAKLLCVLQEGEIDPVGSRGPHKIDVRVIATTNRKLKSWVDEGKFRADLYYRLNVMPFFIPPLRERGEDIEPLSLFFAQKYSEANKRSVTAISQEAMDALKAHDWPGNIRELENTIARAVLMAGSGAIEAADVFMDEPGFMAALEESARRAEAGPRPGPSREASAPSASQGPQARTLPPSQSHGVHPADGAQAPPAGGSAPAGASPSASASASASPPSPSQGELPIMTIDEMEKRLIGKALTQTSGNRTHAARLLGISVRTLRNKLNEYSHMEMEATSAGAAG
jgi:two-component system response regulator FlrC